MNPSIWRGAALRPLVLTTDPALPGPVTPSGLITDDGAEALRICLALGMLSPEQTVERYIASGLELMAGHIDSSCGHLALASRRDRGPTDPALGWRLDVYYSFGGQDGSELRFADDLIQSEAYIHDLGIQRTVRDAGQHRIYHDPDPRTQPTRMTSLDAAIWTARQLVDRVKLVFALAPDLELHFAFDRPASAAPFEPRDIARLHSLVDGLEPWGRRVALLHGRLAEGILLSPRERALACALLDQAPLKKVADALGIGEARARELARGVYRKLRVDGRLGLVQAWAGPREVRTLVPISAPLLRRRRH